MTIKPTFQNILFSLVLSFPTLLIAQEGYVSWAEKLGFPAGEK